MTASQASLVADNTAAATLTATFSSAVADGTVVNFAVTSGTATLNVTSATTVANKASITVKSGTAGTVVIAATSGGLTANMTITFTAVAPGTLALSASPNSLLADDTATSMLSATFGTAVPDGTTVNFAVVSGAATLSAISATTVANTASLTVKSGIAGSVTVTATSGAISGSATLTFTAPPAGTFVIPVSVSQPSVVANDVATSTVIADLTGHNVPDGSTVTFAVASGTATLSATSALTSGGKASVTVKSGTAGVVTVSASFTASGGGTSTGTSPSIAFVLATGLAATASKQVALANNSDLITITASFETPVTNATFTATPVVIGGSNGANALFINNTNSITVNSTGAAVPTLSTTISSGSIGGTIITVTSGTMVGSVYIKFIRQPTAVDVSVALTSASTIGALQYNLTNSAGWNYAVNSAVPQNAAAGSTIFAQQDVLGTTTTVGLINAAGFVPTAMPIEQLTYTLNIGNPANLGVLPVFGISSAGITAETPAFGAIALTPLNFVITLHFNTDTF